MDYFEGGLFLLLLFNVEINEGHQVFLFYVAQFSSDEDQVQQQDLCQFGVRVYHFVFLEKFLGPQQLLLGLLVFLFFLFLSELGFQKRELRAEKQGQQINVGFQFSLQELFHLEKLEFFLSNYILQNLGTLLDVLVLMEEQEKLLESLHLGEGLVVHLEYDALDELFVLVHVESGEVYMVEEVFLYFADGLR